MSLQILKAIWQADGTFPSGSFAFSYGIEGLAAMGAISDKDSLYNVIETVLRFRWATFDRVALTRSFRAQGHPAEIAQIDREVEAATFGEALRAGSRRNGGSFLATHARLGNALAAMLRDAARRGEILGHITVMQGAIWQSMEMDEEMAQIASAYTTASGAASAAVRLGVVSALHAQAVLNDCLPLIEQLNADPVLEDTHLSSFAPVLDIASVRQARADLRLFAN